MPFRVLLLADTHLGFDSPSRPRGARCRRGPDFFANFERALTPARRGEVDLVVHGGDLLFRSRVPPGLVQASLAPLLAVAEQVPVCLVPGNHERSAIPYPLLARHPRLHVLDRPRTLRLEALGLAVSGWPYNPEMADGGFERQLERTGWRERPARLRLLCLHQLVEGSRAGWPEHVFRSGRDVIPGRALPPGFAAVLCGHVHRPQRLDRDLRGRPLATPVLYPGSVERTSFAERRERKGYLLFELEPGDTGGELRALRFVELPTRPMELVELDDASPALLERHLASALAGLPPDAVVRVRLAGSAPPFSAARLRALAPASMTIEWAWRGRPASLPAVRGKVAHGPIGAPRLPSPD
jgi:DNA repair protein SbcD/Mre11